MIQFDNIYVPQRIGTFFKIQNCYHAQTLLVICYLLHKEAIKKIIQSKQILEEFIKFPKIKMSLANGKFQKEELSQNCILGGYVSYINQQSAGLKNIELKFGQSRSMYKKSIECLYNQECQIAYQMHFFEQIKNKKTINSRLLQYLNNKCFFIDKIFSPEGKSLGFGRKTNIRKVDIQRKYNSYICNTLHVLKQAQQIQNYKTHIRRQLSSIHTSPMVQKVQKSVGYILTKPKNWYKTQHMGRQTCVSLNNSPIKAKNPSLNYSRNKSYKGRRLNKQNQGLFLKRNPVRKYQQMKLKVIKIQ